MCLSARFGFRPSWILIPITTLPADCLVTESLFSHLENGAVIPVEVHARHTRRGRSPAMLADHHQETWGDPTE